MRDVRMDALTTEQLEIIILIWTWQLLEFVSHIFD